MESIVVALDDRPNRVGGSFQPVVSCPALPLRFPCRPARFEFPFEYLFGTAYSPPHRAFRMAPVPGASASVAAGHTAQIEHLAATPAARTDQARRSHAAGRNTHQPHGVTLGIRYNCQQARRKVLVFTGSNARQFIEIRPPGSATVPAGKYGSCHG